jgi:hypothetical protein
MDMRIRIYTVSDGHISEGNASVYAWLEPGGVIYVGATLLHPAARAELHLSGDDPEARVLGRLYPERGGVIDERLRFVSFELPPQSDRAAVRQQMMGVLAREHLLSERYFGPTPDRTLRPPAELEGWLTEALTRLSELGRESV